MESVFSHIMFAIRKLGNSQIYGMNTKWISALARTAIHDQIIEVRLNFYNWFHQDSIPEEELKTMEDFKIYIYLIIFFNLGKQLYFPVLFFRLCIHRVRRSRLRKDGVQSCYGFSSTGKLYSCYYKDIDIEGNKMKLVMRLWEMAMIIN